MNFHHFSEALSRIIQSGDVEALKAFFASVKPYHLSNHLHGPNWKGEKIAPPLHQAVAANSCEIFSYLLTLGLNPEQTDIAGRTPLFWALVNEQLPMAHWLMAQGANLLAQSKIGTRIYDVALATGDEALIAAFSTLGLSLDYANQDGTSCLHRAARSGNLALFDRVLRETGLSLETPNADDHLPIDFCRHLVMLQHLHALAPDIPLNRSLKNGDTSLLLFVREGADDIVRWLVEQGEDVNQLGKDKNTALHYAVSRNHLALARFLLERGANPNLRNRYNARPLHWASQLAGGLEMVKLLIAYKAKVNIKTNTTFIIRETRTPLFLAISKGNQDIARYLVEQGADVNASNDSCDSTALTEACHGNHIEMVQFLLAHGASPDGLETEYGDRFMYFPLGQAASADIVDLLVAAGAQINAQNLYGETALHFIAGRIEKSDLQHAHGQAQLGALQALLKHGADVRLTNQHGQSALAQAKCAEVGKLLLEAAKANRPRLPGASQAVVDPTFPPPVAEPATPGTPPEASALPTPARISKDERTQGKELLELTFDISNAAKLDAVIEIARLAAPAVVRHAATATATAEDQETALHRVLDSARRYARQDDQPSLLPQFHLLAGMLLEQGADPNAIEMLYQESALHKAVRIAVFDREEDAAQAEVMSSLLLRLLDCGADINLRNRDGCTPLDFISHPALYALLESRGARHGQCSQALYDAIVDENHPVLDWLLRKGIDPNNSHRQGLSPLMVAALCNNLTALRRLLEHGAKPESTRGDGGTVLHAACEGGAFNCIHYLVEHGIVDFNQQDHAGNTALCALLAYEKHHYDNAVVKQARKDAEATAVWMVSQGARLDIVNQDGESALAFAKTKALQARLRKQAKAQP
ncbi:ankyrin repeat domain-containing protein [Parachitinimonas caeni]|uniref:Ankyrin repeat domain-containing protein n=1 Tax=Parachitinimonas caeni TaxID=3031301 RepID=A0ABT7DWF6_9NEIS|nr:ankyrin repeat domain-containing protein [Parachitinimonas caeni]MDK2124319.1 ankyrin repeat domain-containing protein [Parachitinimonas caeni]